MPFYVAAKRHSVVHWDKCRLHSCKISQSKCSNENIYPYILLFKICFEIILKTNPTRLNFLYNFYIDDKGVDELKIQNSLNRLSALGHHNILT